MGQLGRPLIILTVEGAILAVVVFAVVVWLVPRPIRWYRIVGVIALLISLIPDLLLGLGEEICGGQDQRCRPFSRFGAQFFGTAGEAEHPGLWAPSPGDVLPGLPGIGC